MRIGVAMLFLIAISAIFAADPQQASTNPSDQAASTGSPIYWLEKAVKPTMATTDPYEKGDYLFRLAELYTYINLYQEAGKCLAETLTCAEQLLKKIDADGSDQSDIEKASRMLRGIAFSQNKLNDKVSCIKTMQLMEGLIGKLSAEEANLLLDQIAWLQAEMHDKEACIKTLHVLEDKASQAKDENNLWGEIGNIYIELGEYQQVDNLISKIKNEEFLADYLVGMAVELYRKGMFEKAAWYTEKVRPYASKDKTIMDSINKWEAIEDSYNGKFADAIKKAENVENDRIKTWLLMRIAEEAFRQGNKNIYDKLTREAENILAEKSFNTEDKSFLLGLMLQNYLMAGRLDKAEELAKLFPEGSSKYQAWISIARCQAAHKKTFAARASLETALKYSESSKSEDSHEYYSKAPIAGCYARLGDLEQAIEMFNTNERIYKPDYAESISYGAVYAGKTDALAKWVDTLEGEIQIRACITAATALISEAPTTKPATSPASAPASNP